MYIYLLLFISNCYYDLYDIYTSYSFRLTLEVPLISSSRQCQKTRDSSIGFTWCSDQTERPCYYGNHLCVKFNMHYLCITPLKYFKSPWQRTGILLVCSDFHSPPTLVCMCIFFVSSVGESKGHMISFHHDNNMLN